MAPSKLLLIFDLDGTLIDSSEDLAISVNAALQHIGREPLGHSLIHSFVGNGAPMLIHRAVGSGTPEDVEAEALAFFLKFYRTHALQHTRLYDGIREALDHASFAGHKLSILTNKPVRISEDIVKALHLGSHFFRVYGGDSFDMKKPDPIGIQTLQKEASVSASLTMMIGDSHVDMQTARNAGVKSCGVLWGFQPDSVRKESPDYLIASPSDLPSVWSKSAVVPGRGRS